MKQKVREEFRKIGFKVKTVVTIAALYLAWPMQVLGSENEPIIVTGTRLLLAAVIGILTGFIVTLITINAIKVGMKWINASAEEKPKYQKELIQVIAAGVVTLTIGASITWIVGFYQG